MTMLELGFWSFPALLIMIFLRAPIGLAMMLAGIGGIWMALGDTNMFMSKLKSETFSTFSSYSLSIIPMFLLMGQFATLSGMSSSSNPLGRVIVGLPEKSKGAVKRMIAPRTAGSDP